MRELLLATITFLLATPAARADVASDRVVLIPGAACPGNAAIGRDLVRIRQNPDGTSSIDTGPFVVPNGYLLEVTDVEFQPQIALPRFQQSVVLSVQNRATSSEYVAASFAFGPAQLAVLTNKASSTLDGTTQYTSDSLATRKLTFGSGPLVSPAARLCVEVSTPLTELPGSGHQLLIRGRLLANGTTTGVALPPNGGTSIFQP